MDVWIPVKAHKLTNWGETTQGETPLDIQYFLLTNYKLSRELAIQLRTLCPSVKAIFGETSFFSSCLFRTTTISGSDATVVTRLLTQEIGLWYFNS